MEKSIENLEVWSNSAKIEVSRAGSQYVRCTAIQRDKDGTIAKFLNLCFFPNQADCMKLRNILCQGRTINIVGNYSEREYTGRDGNQKIAYDVLVHSVKFGEVNEWEGGERKVTEFSFIKESDEKAAEAEFKKNEAKRAKTQAKPQQTTTIESAVMDDEFFKDLDI